MKKTYLNERPRDCSPPSKMRLKESLNTECPKLSDKTTRPPVLSIATFISASPTWWHCKQWQSFFLKKKKSSSNMSSRNKKTGVEQRNP